jgi:hypothetical protein
MLTATTSKALGGILQPDASHNGTPLFFKKVASRAGGKKARST